MSVMGQQSTVKRIVTGDIAERNQRFPGVGQRIARRLNALGYWKAGRADVRRFCLEKQYTPQNVYKWLGNDSIPSYENLPRLARDLDAPMCWILLGGPGIRELRAYEMRAAPKSVKADRRDIIALLGD